MSRAPTWQQRLFALVQWLKGFRYIKFGLVGASGTVVNVVVLHVAQEYLLRAIEPPGTRLYASLALAICLATVNNFTWNRLWTWADRLREAAAHAAATERASAMGSILSQLGRYTLASWLGIALQYGLTLWLSSAMDYRLANIIAIVVASISNFLAHEYWSFRHRPRD